MAAFVPQCGILLKSFSQRPATYRGPSKDSVQEGRLLLVCKMPFADFLVSIPVKPIGLQRYEVNSGVPLARILFR